MDYDTVYVVKTTQHDENDLLVVNIVLYYSQEKALEYIKANQDELEFAKVEIIPYFMNEDTCGNSVIDIFKEQEKEYDY